MLLLRLHGVLELRFLLTESDLVREESLHLPAELFSVGAKRILLARQARGLLLELVDDVLLLSLELALELDLLADQSLALRR